MGIGRGIAVGVGIGVGRSVEAGVGAAVGVTTLFEHHRLSNEQALVSSALASVYWPKFR